MTHDTANGQTPTPPDAGLPCGPPPAPPTRHVLSTSWLRSVTAALAVLATGKAAADLRARRDPLRGPALPLGLAAGWCVVKQATTPRPRLTYRRELRDGADLGLALAPVPMWTVTLANSGGAAALVSAVSWFGRRTDGREVAADDALGLAPLFVSCGVEDRDYLLFRLTAGWSLAPGASETLCALPREIAVQFASLGVTLTVDEGLGAKASYRVEAIPPHGLPQAVLLPPEAEDAGAT